MFKIPFLYLTKLVEAFFRKPLMRRLSSKFPRLVSFIRNRFKPDVFFGLPFTVLFIIICVNLVMLSKLAEQTVNSENVKLLDMEVTAWFFNLRTPFLNKAFYYFTLLGTVYGVTVGTVITGLILLWQKRGFHVLALLISILGSSLSMYYSKIYFHRDRPLNVSYYTPENSYSFPSGHATSAMALVGLLCYFVIIEIEDKRLRLSLFMLGISYILLIGLSRIYLGVHFLTDVAAGYLLGLVWVIVAIGLMEYTAISKVKHKLE